MTQAFRSSQRFTWTVNNLAPTATNNTGTVTEDATLTDTGNLISDDDGDGVDNDPDNDALSIAEVNGGSVTGSSSIAGKLRHAHRRQQRQLQLRGE